MTVETVINNVSKSDIIQHNSEPTLEDILAIPVPYELRVVVTDPESETSYDQIIVGARVTKESVEYWHAKFRSVPWDGAVAFWAALPDPEDEGRSAGQIADAVVFENYGPVGDSVVYQAAASSVEDGRDIDMELVLDHALELEHLTGDGIMAMMRQVAVRARHGYVRNPF